MRQPLTGKPCDPTHPFPAPDEAAWVDSMEYGALRRQSTTNSFATQDTDTSPTWRVLGAWVWGAACLQDHVLEVANSSILTTHLLAVAMLSRKSVHVIESLAFGQVGGNAAIDALVNGGGLEPAHEEVQQLDLDSRRQLVGECTALVVKGFTNLQLDIEAHYLPRSSA